MILINHRHLQLVCTLPEIFFIYLCYKLIPESPRWLLINGQFTQAEKVIRLGAERNNVQIDGSLRKLVTKYQDEIESHKPKNITLIDLWRTPNLRRKTFLLYFTWAVNGFVYYGLSFNTNSLGGDMYLNFVLIGVVEIPAYILTMFVLRKFGRRLPLSFAMLGAGLAFLFTLPFASIEKLLWLRTTLSMIGKFCITSSFAIIYLVSSFLYTVTNLKPDITI